MSILGNRVLRKEDPKFLTVGGSYVDDLQIPGAAWVTYVRSPEAHARIAQVDTAAALAAPGVLDVFTASDLQLPPLPMELPMLNPAMARPLLADGVVRFVGEAVAAVVAETKAQARDGADLVEVEYEPLPVVVDPEESAASETLLFEEAGSNVALELSFGHDESLFDGCEVVVTQRVVNQRLAPCPLEVRAAAARVEKDGRLTFWVSSQNPFAARELLAKVLEIEPEKIRVMAPDVGGGFGSKIFSYPEELLVAWMAMRLGSPRALDRDPLREHGEPRPRAPQVQRITIGGARDGTVSAYRLEIIQTPAGTRHSVRSCRCSRGPCSQAHTTSRRRSATPCRSSPTPPPSSPTEVRDARRPLQLSSGPWTSSRRRSRWTPPRCGDATW